MLANEIIAKAVTVCDNLEKQGKNVPILLLSHAGFGKTTTLALLAQYLDYNLITLIPSQYAYDDILGISSVSEESKKNKTTEKLMPSWLYKMKQQAKNGKRNILFVDEITTCDPLLQGPLLNVIFNRTLGEYDLPENTFIVAGGNYPKDLNNSFELFIPLLNRFMLVNIMREDLSTTEVIDEEFDDLLSNLSNETIESFLNLKTSDSNYVDFSLIKQYFKDEIAFTNDYSTEYMDEIGMLGVSSTRSLNYSIKFIREYTKLWSDDLWTRIVGDTLGKCEHKDNKVWRSVLSSKFDTFINDKLKIEGKKNSFDSLIESINAGDMKKALVYISNLKLKDLSIKQTQTLNETIKKATNISNDDKINLTRYLI